MDHPEVGPRRRYTKEAGSFKRNPATNEKPSRADIRFSRDMRQFGATCATRLKSSRQTRAGSIERTNESVGTTSLSNAKRGNLRAQRCGKPSEGAAGGGIPGPRRSSCSPATNGPQERCCPSFLRDTKVEQMVAVPPWPPEGGGWRRMRGRPPPPIECLFC